MTTPASISGHLTSEGTHILPIRIYFEDTDFTGIVYHANYLRFFERGRTEFLRAKGIDHTALQEGAMGESLAFAVANLKIDYKRPARIDDIVEVRSRVDRMHGARILMVQEIHRESTLMTALTVTLVLLGTDGRPRPVPQGLIEALG